MSDRVLRYKEHVWETDYRLWFPTTSGSGYSFPCNESGDVARAHLAPEALANLHRLTAEEGRTGEIVADENRRTIPGLMKCECGRKLEMWDHRDISCGCGRDYNSAGSLLAPRSQWGEETGETAADWDAGVAEGEARAHDGERSFAYEG